MDTQRGAVTKEFARLEALYAQIEHAAGLGVWEWDIGSGRVVWSDGLYRIYEREPGRFTPSFDAYLGLVHPDDRERVRRDIEGAVRAGSSFSHEERVLLPDGSLRHIRTWGRPSRDGSGRLAGLVGVCQDVTQIAAARETALSLEMELRARVEAKASELAYKSAVLAAEQEASLDGILVVDAEGRIQSRNRRLNEMWDIPESVFATGSDARALEAALTKLVEPEAFLARVRWLYDHPLEKSFETLELRDGRTLERYSSPVLDGDRLLGRVWYFRDVSERVRAEEKAKAHAESLARSNADLEMYAAAAAHDLSAPLRRLVGFADILDRRCRSRLEPEDLDMLSRIKESAGRMAALVHDVLALSRVGFQESEPAPVALDLVLKRVCSDLEAQIAEAGAELSIGPLPEVCAHEALMVELFQNLVSNALKFRSPDRRLRIEVGSRPAPAGGLAVSVRDNGIGFDPKQSREIFEPFRRLHASEFKGSGIGLAICERIALRHGWRLTAEGRPGQGASFTVLIPASSLPRTGG